MKLTIRCREFKPLVRNTLIGFADVHISEMRLVVRDVAVHTKNGKRWAQLPAKPQIRDGTLVKNEDGKIQYVPIMHFDTREVADAFSAAVINAVLELVPEAFDAEAAVS
jgi:hypothetical protein